MSRYRPFLFIILTLAVLSGCHTGSMHNPEIKDILEQLDKVVEDRDIYTQKKEGRIAGMKSLLYDNMSAEERYKVYDRIYDEYYQYNLDSAIVYAKKKFDLTDGITPPYFRTDARLDLAERHILSGAHVDAIRILDEIDTVFMDRGLLARYYHIRQSLYEDMSGAADDPELKLQYDRMRKHYRQMRLEQLDSNAIEYLYVTSEIMREQGRAKSILPQLQQRCISPETDSHQKAILNYITANIYRQLGDSLNVIYYYATSAINDLCTPVNDYRSLHELAMQLYNAGDIERAYSYTTRSVKDFLVAHTRLNIQSTVDILPVITSAYESQMKERHRQLTFLLIWLSLMMTMLLCAMLVIIRERGRTRKKNELLREANVKLKDFNSMLLEANDIKEAYLSKYMDLCSSYIENLDNYRSQLRKTAKTGGFEKIMENLRSANYTDAVLHDFYTEFDATFLKLFPDFVSQLNAMLQPDKRLKDTSADGILTTELRVMALIRLGINDSTKIAHFLRRSLSTIYNYRVKIRNAAAGDRDNFESMVMRISFSPSRGAGGVKKTK